jgi:uncharacterized protein (TIGR03492 family)
MKPAQNASDTRVLFVSNGHGEIAISERIAAELPPQITCDHLALVGGLETRANAVADSRLREVGPRRQMPSGGLLAMGNVRNIIGDVRAGLIGHTLAQLRFLRGVQATYRVVVAVGDVYALVMALRARGGATMYVGTAKSVYVAPYGALEERIIARAQSVFVRDAATAQRLSERGVYARAANVIVDLYANGEGDTIDAPFDPRFTVLPGSRESAYVDAVRLARIVRELHRALPRAGALLSIAPALNASTMASALAGDGWRVKQRENTLSPFSLYVDESEVVRAWRGSLAALLRGATLVLGQAGTANEAAAAAGVPVVAFERGREHAWYRKRQIALLGDALLVVTGDEVEAARSVMQLLGDTAQRQHMSQAGRLRMGVPGGARRIAQEVTKLCAL